MLGLLHVAGDALDLFVETTTFLTENLRVALTFDWERRGTENPPVRGKTAAEEDFQVGLGFRYRYSPTVTLEGRYAYEHIRNSNILPAFHEADRPATCRFYLPDRVAA